MSRIGIAATILLLAVAGTLHAGPYAGATSGMSYDDPRIAGWATSCSVSWPSGFTPYYNDPTMALGAAPGTSNDVVTLGNGGTAVLAFGRAVSNGPGADLVVFENGFKTSTSATTLFAELAFVEVSTDGVNYARFPSVSLNTVPDNDYSPIDPTCIYNLAGKTVNNNGQAWQGTTFDLSDLETNALVLSGAVDIENILFVRIVDVYGSFRGSTIYDEATLLIDPATGTYYATNHVIYDGGNFGMELAGFDLDAVGIVEAVDGDANGDGKVDGSDLAVWQQHYDPLGLNAATNDAETGDWSGDGKVDGGDLSIWQQNYNPIGILSGAAADAIELRAVPEPTAAVVMLVALAGGALWRRKRLVR